MIEKSGWIEIELLNGKHILIDSDITKIHDASEKIKSKLRFSLKFPFVKVEKTRYTEFQYRQKYESFNKSDDPKYKANCRLVQFMNLIGVDVKPFPYEQFKIEDDLRG